MTKQEKIREHLAGEYCGFMSQEYCISSDCPQGGGFCRSASEYADNQIKELDKLGVVLKVFHEGKLKHRHTKQSFAWTTYEPLIEESNLDHSDRTINHQDY